MTSPLIAKSLFGGVTSPEEIESLVDLVLRATAGTPDP
jgi:hypothetical protein